MLHRMSRLYLAHDGFLHDRKSGRNLPCDYGMLPDWNTIARLAIDQHSELHKTWCYMGIL